MLPDNASTLDPVDTAVSSLSDAAESATAASANALSNRVVRNPVPATLAAGLAAVGKGRRRHALDLIAGGLP
jgi:hypothetical protein